MLATLFVDEKTTSVHKPRRSKVSAKNDILAGLEYDFYIFCIGGAGHVVVDLSRGASFIPRKKFGNEVLDAGVVITIRPGVVGEFLYVPDVPHLDLGLEEVSLVQEQDHGGVGEERIVADVIKQIQCFDHTIGIHILKQVLIVLGDSRNKDNSGDTFKAVDPLLAFIALTSHIIHFEDGSVNVIHLGNDTSGSNSRVHDIIFLWDPVRLLDLVDFVKEKLNSLNNLEFIPSAPHHLYPRIHP